MGSVSAGSARVVVEHCRALGADGDALLSAAALSWASIQDPSARVDERAVSTLWATAYRTLQDPALGLHMAESARKGSYGIMHFISSHSPTVGAAFEGICAYSRWANDSRELRVIEQGDHFAVELDPVPGSPCAQLMAAEYTLALSFLGVARSTALALAPLRVDFAVQAPSDRAERERVFGAPVRFGQPINRLWLDRQTWERPVPGADAALLALLEAHARTLLERLPPQASLLSDARALIDQRLPEGPPTIHELARMLGMSVRSLQRALAGQQVSFSDLVEHARIARARKLLADRSLTIAEIALMLGFSEQSAFTRACKRWLGMPPIKLRATAEGG